MGSAGMGSEIFDMTVVCGAFVKPDGGSMRSLSAHARFFYPVIWQGASGRIDPLRYRARLRP